MRNSNFKNYIFGLVIVANLVWINAVLADNVKLADKPLVGSSTSDVLPNLMFVLDNSGSMGFSHTPDWVDDSPYGSNPMLRNNPTFNTQFYNPNIQYTPAVKFDGTSFPSQTTWTSVRNDAFYSFNGSLSQGTKNLVGNASYYYFVAGEYCKSANLTECEAATSVTGVYKFAAPIRWCNSSAAAISTTVPSGTGVNSCRAVREGSFIHLRSPSATSTLTISTSNSNRDMTSLRVDGKEIMAGTASGNNNANTFASRVVAEINECSNAISGDCEIAGFSATRNNNVITILSPYGATVAPTFTTSGSGGITFTTNPFVTRTPGKAVFVNIISTTTSYPIPGSSSKGGDRTDCAGSVCTYSEEMTNYANWYTYYRTRMQGMKTSASLAFKTIDSRYRVGFITINLPGSNYLPIAKYELGSGNQKNLWYTKLFSTLPDGGTPLRSALTRVGRIFAHKESSFPQDPIEYACQPNFTLLTTDGYWNTDSASDVKNLTGGSVGNLDNEVNTRPKYEGPTATLNSLADAAKYYYDNDIRTSSLNNCTGALGQNVCGEGVGNENNLKQNMTTLTLGLGIDGKLTYSSDYKTQTVGAFADLIVGDDNWPVPELLKPGAVAGNEGPGHIDDLWHAAVNSNGTYFSARNPKELSDSLKKALADIQSKVGAGSAASASSLQPTAGDNFNYVASYETVKWIGNLEAREVDLETFVTLEKATWCVENVAADTCAPPATLISNPSGTAFYCATKNSTESDCSSLGGDLDIITNPSVPTCKVNVAPSCTGVMSGRVGDTADTRTIKFNSGGTLSDFTYSALPGSLKQYFESNYLSTRLTQWVEYTSGTGGQQSKAEGAGIVNFLRGQKGFEDRSSNLAENRLFRYREATLGDITESQPAFISKPVFTYTDAGYQDFKNAQVSRAGRIYVGANDGMLHAFNATNGQEVWAFVPTPVIPNLWKLADKNYATSHRNYVNGDPVIGEVCVAACNSTSAVWKTILVGGLSGGGRGYYALDITDPNSPILLWEFTTAQSANLGYSFGTPVITKLNDSAGTWVVLFTSGYNNGSKDNDGVTTNVPTGNGVGQLYVVNAVTGGIVREISTGVGTATTPSGLGQIAAYVDDLSKNNLATFVYGGDLLGNLWRFDINTGSVVNIATLRGPGNLAQPITTAPQLGVINKKRVIFVGTGKYLEVADLTNTEPQTLYAIKDANLTSSLGDPRGSLVAQTITQSGTSRTGSDVAVDFNTALGWRVDFPDSGERMNIESFLVNGVLLAPTIVPQSSSCSPGGYGWFNYFNYKTGGALPNIGGIVSEKLNSPAVGFNLVYDQDGKPVVTVVEADDPTPHLIDNSDVVSESGSNRTTILRKNDNNTYGRKYIWRELIP